MTVYLIHSISLLMSAVQVFCGGKMAVVAHLVGLEQLGYETDLGLTTAVRGKMTSIFSCGKTLILATFIINSICLRNFNLSRARR